MRAVTFSDPQVKALVRENFVCSWKSKEPSSYIGIFPVLEKNGDGESNIRTLLMTPDGITLHELKGYWSPGFFVEELQFTMKLRDVFRKQDADVTRAKEKVAELHRAHAKLHWARLGEKKADPAERRLAETHERLARELSR